MSDIIDREMVVIDFETTGTDVREDRIVSIAAIKVPPGLQGQEEKHYLIDPGVPIPPEASAIHGITDDMVRGKPTFAKLAKGFLAWMGDADIAGYNIRGFDLPILVEELNRAGLVLELKGRRVLDAMPVYFRQHPRDLAAAVRQYCGVELKDAHNALNDARAARDVLLCQIIELAGELREGEEEHVLDTVQRIGDEDRPLRLNELGRWFDIEGEDDEGNPVLRFRQGKHKKRLLLEVAQDPDDRSYLEWMLREVKDTDVAHAIAMAQLRARGPHAKVPEPPTPQMGLPF